MTASDETPSVTAPTASGPVRGAVVGGVTRFLGIPYAAAPVGPLRFREPRPPEPWSTVRDALKQGPTAPQPATPEMKEIDLKPLLGEGWIRGDDFLNLNVWTPGLSASGLPVMVWIHGGSWLAGSNLCDVYDGTAFARDGVVLVSINYRMGVEGFLPLPGVPANLGLLDQIAALRWVKDNIAAFGGDPANVTVFGESAGAMSIGNLLASPLCKGLFRRAIIQSGHASMTRSIDKMQRVAEWLAKRLKIPATVAGFDSIGADETLKAIEAAQKPTSRLDLRDETGFEPVYGLSRFAPTHGDAVNPVPPLEAIRGGAGAGVDVLIGSNLEEMNLYTVPLKAHRWVWNGLARYVLGKFHPQGREILAAYGLGREGRKAGIVLGEAMTDLVFRQGARDLACAHRGRTWMYAFDWGSPAFGGELGAAHAVEVPFVFDTLDSCGGPRGFVGPDAPRDLAERMHRVWIGFARDGTAPWPEYDAATRQVWQPFADEVVTEAEVPAARFAR